MKKDIEIFNHPRFGLIRVVTLPDGQKGFVGKDVAGALGYSKPQNAIATHVDDDDRTTALIQGTGSNYKSQAIIINESGLYALILSSKLPQAREFKHWVTSEVLPQIRRTGGYVPVSPEDNDAAIYKVHRRFFCAIFWGCEGIVADVAVVAVVASLILVVGGRKGQEGRR